MHNVSCIGNSQSPLLVVNDIIFKLHNDALEKRGSKFVSSEDLLSVSDIQFNFGHILKPLKNSQHRPTMQINLTLRFWFI